MTKEEISRVAEFLRSPAHPKHPAQTLALAVSLAAALDRAVSGDSGALDKILSGLKPKVGAPKDPTGNRKKALRAAVLGKNNIYKDPAWKEKTWRQITSDLAAQGVHYTKESVQDLYTKSEDSELLTKVVAEVAADLLAADDPRA